MRRRGDRAEITWVDWDVGVVRILAFWDWGEMDLGLDGDWSVLGGQATRHSRERHGGALGRTGSVGSRSRSRRRGGSGRRGRRRGLDGDDDSVRFVVRVHLDAL
jgi:hypothetical protein